MKVSDGARSDPFAPRQTLSQTERTLLDFLARGFAMKQIGEQMNLTTRTVQKYVTDLRLKMEAKNNAQLIAYALASKKKRREIKQDPFASRQTLSESEREVIELLSRGWTAREIGEHMALNSRTIERHIENLRLKMNARNVAHLIANAFLKGTLKVARGRITVSR